MKYDNEYSILRPFWKENYYMMKKILTFIVVVTMILGLVGCSETTVENANESNKSSMFVVVESTSL